MRVLVVIGKLSGGGAERVTATWVAGLLDRGHEVSVLTHVDTGRTDTLLRIRQKHLALRGKAARWAGVPLGIRHEIGIQAPDVILGVLDFCNLAVLAAVNSLPVAKRPAVVLSEHTIMSLYLRTQGKGGVARSTFGKCLYRRADAAIAVSHAAATDLITTYKVPAGKVFVLPNPLTVRPPNRTTGRPVLARQGRPPRQGFIRLIYVGRLVPEKRPGLVLATAAELRAMGFACEVTIIGDGPLLGQLRLLANQLGVTVVFSGWLEDWREAADQVDCLLLPSLVEGFGVVLIEAAQLGIPSVAPSTALGVADAILPGLTGALAISARPSDLADAVLEALKIKETSSATSAAWLDRFSVGSSLDRLETVLARAMEARR